MKSKRWIKVGSDKVSLGIILNLCDLLNVPIKKNVIKRDLYSHPDYPSLLAISEIIEGYGIDNEGIWIEDKAKTLDTFKEIPMPFITELTTESGEVAGIIVTELDGDLIEYLDPLNGYIKEESAFFFERWMGSALLVEVNNEKVTALGKGIHNPSLIFYKLLTWGVPIISLALTLVLYYLHRDLTELGLGITSILGIILTTQLMHEELENDLISSICSDWTKEGCLPILRSKLSMLFNAIGLAELGLIYFISSFSIIVIFGVFANSTYPLIFYFTITSFLGVIFSLVSFYNQVKVVGTACLICNLVFFIFWGQCAISIIPFYQEYHFSFTDFPLVHALPIAFVYLSTFFFGLMIRQWIHLSQDFKLLDIRMEYLQKTPWFFEELQKNSQEEIDPIELNELKLGNPNAEHHVNLILSPYSFACGKIFNQVKDAHFKHGIQNYDVTIRISIPKLGTVGYSIVDKIVIRKFMFITESWEEKLAIVDDCYKRLEQNTPQKWKDDSRVTAHRDAIETQANQLNQWLSANDISQTPTLILDNRIIPAVFLTKYIDLLCKADEKS